VSRLPGPPLEDPPTSPPRPGMGGLWGDRGGTPGARAATTAGGAASEAACQDSSAGGPAADVLPSAATGAAVEPARAHQCICGPASGMAGDRGDDLGGAHSDDAQRRREHDTQFVKRARR
jgi:hypothetical protein